MGFGAKWGFWTVLGVFWVGGEGLEGWLAKPEGVGPGTVRVLRQTLKVFGKSSALIANEGVSRRAPGWRCGGGCEVCRWPWRGDRAGCLATREAHGLRGMGTQWGTSAHAGAADRPPEAWSAEGRAATRWARERHVFAEGLGCPGPWESRGVQENHGVEHFSLATEAGGCYYYGVDCAQRTRGATVQKPAEGLRISASEAK